MNAQPLFTVFTPTFNRKHTLGRVLESLKAQTLRDFEWLIVDDGSTDDTEPLIRQWQDEVDFPIRYIYQKHAGKPVAFNRGVQEARGALFLTLDSDDACVPEALERLKFHWESIPAAEKGEFSGITVLCKDEEGRLVGTPFPKDILDCHSIELAWKYGVRGEKWGFHRSDVLRRFPFPIIPQELFVPEGVVWNRIGRAYRMRCVNESLRVFYKTSDGLNASIDDVRIRNPLGARLYYQESLDLRGSSVQKLRAAINYIRFSFHARVTLSQLLKEGGWRPLLVLVLPMGYLFFRKDKERQVRKGNSGANKAPSLPPEGQRVVDR